MFLFNWLEYNILFLKQLAYNGEEAFEHVEATLIANEKKKGDAYVETRFFCDPSRGDHCV